jgi:hypothetical protein
MRTAAIRRAGLQRTAAVWSARILWAAMWRTVVRKTQMLQGCLQGNRREVRLKRASDRLRPILNLNLTLILIVDFLFCRDFIAINDGDKPHHMIVAKEKEKEREEQRERERERLSLLCDHSII